MKAVQNIDVGSGIAMESAVVASTMLEPSVSVVLPASEPGVDQDLANELAVAQAIQQSLLPKEFPHLPGFGLAAFCQSARHIGGDFYDALPLGSSRALLVVADVMGKGVPAALFAASLRILVRSCVESKPGPGELLKYINRQMFEELSSVDMFITAQVVLVDMRYRRLQIASAGHCPLLLASAKDGLQSIAPHGLPLGIDPDAAYAERTARLQPGSCALLYTDGLTEACDPMGTAFGQERLMAWLAQHAGASLCAAELKDQFLTEFRTFQGNGALRDDLTLLLLAEEAFSSAPGRSESTWTRQE